MKFAVVTTLHRKGLEQYGEPFLASFQENWPEGVELLCFAEGWDARSIPINVLTKVKLYDLELECPDLVAFKMRHCNNLSAQGVAPDGRTYNYRMDAVRFCHKIFALARAAEIVAEDPEITHLIWLDADVVTHTKMPVEFLEGLLPEPRDIAYLRRSGQFHYPECGFVIYNVRREPARMLIRMMRELWRKDQVFGLPEWHDSFVFNVLLEGMVAEKMLAARSISGGFEEHEHPFINGPLGQYMDHLKGPIRKQVGASLAEDVDPHVRKESYWGDVLLTEKLVASGERFPQESDGGKGRTDGAEVEKPAKAPRRARRAVGSSKGKKKATAKVAAE